MIDEIFDVNTTEEEIEAVTDTQPLTENEPEAEVASASETESEIKENLNAHNKISRYKKREQTFLIVFESLFSDTSVDEIADNFTDSTAQFYSDEAIKTAGIIQELATELDEKISAFLTKGWRINRISKISLAVLRVAVYEITYCEEIPVSVSINEAVELAKKYSVSEDASFVNGLLGSLVKGKA